MTTTNETNEATEADREARKRAGRRRYDAQMAVYRQREAANRAAKSAYIAEHGSAEDWDA